MTYSIKEVSEAFDLSISTIRFYDKQGLLPFVAKNKSGHRAFTESDLYLIQTICCLKNTGMHIKDIKTYIRLVMEGTDTIESRKALLINHKKQVNAEITKLNENMKELQQKIDIYSANNAVDIIEQQIKLVNSEKKEQHFSKDFFIKQD